MLRRKPRLLTVGSAVTRTTQAALIAVMALCSAAQAAPLLGTREALSASPVCAAYRCTPGPVHPAGGAFTRRTTTVTVGDTPLSITELRRDQVLVSVRWSEPYQDTVLDPKRLAFLQALSAAVTGQKPSAAKLTDIDHRSLQGLSSPPVALGTGQLSAAVQPYGDTRLLSVLLTRGAPSGLGIQEPPPTTMNAQQKAQALQAIASAFTAQGSGRRVNRECGLGLFLALETSVPTAQQPWEEILGARLERAARAAMFTVSRGYHAQFRGTGYDWELGEDATFICVRLIDQPVR